METDPAPPPLTARRRRLVIAAALLALFLGALDALVMSAAMPTVVAELGGLDLYSWVYSAYLLTRTVALPVFGKLADLFRMRALYAVAILVFMAASLAAGFSRGMEFLIVCRALQGIGAGGTFALVYVVLAEISPPGERGKTLSLGSAVWGLASVLGPAAGGFIVATLAWPWIFFINLPLGALSLLGVAASPVATRPRKARPAIDAAGAAALTAAVLCLLLVFLLTGEGRAFGSPLILSLAAGALVFTAAFIRIERRAAEPILSLAFFRSRGFSAGNAAVFLSSFAIFSFFAFAPLFVQGALGKTPVEVGGTVLALSLGWSVGSLALGRRIHRWGNRRAAAWGAALLAAGSALTLAFSTESSSAACFAVFFVVGAGMGAVSLATILIVQESAPAADLGVATSAHQFARNLGGAVGVGVGGGLFTAALAAFPALAAGLPPEIGAGAARSIESLFRPEVQSALSPEALRLVREAVSQGVAPVFGSCIAAALACLACCLSLPRDAAAKRPPA
jgi:EmrB/QacA subfamily drug resistance transporter